MTNYNTLIYQEDFSWDKYHDYIYKIIYRKLNDHQDTEEVTQNTILSVFESAHNLKADNELSFKMWLAAICRGQISSYLEKKKAKDIVVIGEISTEKDGSFVLLNGDIVYVNHVKEIIEEKFSGEIINHGKGKLSVKNKFLHKTVKKNRDVMYEDKMLHTSSDSSDLNDDYDEKIELVKEVIEKIKNEDVKKTIKLFYFEGLKTREIASLTNTPSGTISWRISDFKEKAVKVFRKRGFLDMFLLFFIF